MMNLKLDRNITNSFSSSCDSYLEFRDADLRMVVCLVLIQFECTYQDHNRDSDSAESCGFHPSIKYAFFVAVVLHLDPLTHPECQKL